MFKLLLIYGKILRALDKIWNMMNATPTEEDEPTTCCNCGKELWIDYLYSTAHIDGYDLCMDCREADYLV